ncbi:hypothetical protein Scep_001613 [Stephania cephalantha]|uniref:Uncharacterized protein n=1 Tax=Stephania cephalantha TaxID=152367 RepID=A0AAP0L8A9_9MAGN
MMRVAYDANVHRLDAHEAILYFVLVQAELVRRLEEHTLATSDRPIDEEQLYYDAAGDFPKGHAVKKARTTQRKLGDGADAHPEEIEELLNEEKWFVCDVVMVRRHMAASDWSVFLRALTLRLLIDEDRL